MGSGGLQLAREASLGLSSCDAEKSREIIPPKLKHFTNLQK